MAWEEVLIDSEIERLHDQILRALTAANVKVPEYKESFDAFKQAWLDYPSQDNEGYVPDRGGFKSGWLSCYHWMTDKMGHQEDAGEGGLWA
jgi:hypothetical protein